MALHLDVEPPVARNVLLRAKGRGLADVSGRARAARWEALDGAGASKKPRTIADVAARVASKAKAPKKNGKKAPASVAPTGDPIVDALRAGMLAEQARFEQRMAKFNAALEALS